MRSAKEEVDALRIVVRKLESDKVNDAMQKKAMIPHYKEENEILKRMINEMKNAQNVAVLGVKTSAGAEAVGGDAGGTFLMFLSNNALLLCTHAHFDAHILSSLLLSYLLLSFDTSTLQ